MHKNAKCNASLQKPKIENANFEECKLPVGSKNAIISSLLQFHFQYRSIHPHKAQISLRMPDCLNRVPLLWRVHSKWYKIAGAELPKTSNIFGRGIIPVKKNASSAPLSGDWGPQWYEKDEVERIKANRHKAIDRGR